MAVAFLVSSGIDDQVKKNKAKFEELEWSTEVIKLIKSDTHNIFFVVGSATYKGKQVNFWGQDTDIPRKIITKILIRFNGRDYEMPNDLLWDLSTVGGNYTIDGLALNDKEDSLNFCLNAGDGIYAYNAKFTVNILKKIPTLRYVRYGSDYYEVFK